MAVNIVMTSHSNDHSFGNSMNGLINYRIKEKTVFSDQLLIIQLH